MREQDKADFTKALNLCCATLRQPLPEVDSLKFWFMLLEPYPLADVKAALIHHMQTGRFAPAPVDVIGHINKSVDYWATPDEAWAIASKSYAKPGEREANTVVTCNEIEQALGHVRHLLDDGDKFNAPRAFKAAYERIVDVERQKHAKPRWRVSLGADSSQHDVVIGKAINEGRIALVDARAASPMLAAPGDDAPIDPKTAAQNRSKVADVLALLAKPRAAGKTADMAADVAATRDAAAKQARRAADYEEAQKRQKAEAEAFRVIASTAHLSDDKIAEVVRLFADHMEAA
jgi:hypothetical protein